MFILCGGLGTITNVIFSSLLSLTLPATLSYVIGYGASMFVTYALNAKFIFKEQFTFASFLKFILSYIPNFIILFVFVAVLIQVFEINRYLVFISAGLLGIPITYILVKLHAFNK